MTTVSLEQDDLTLADVAKLVTDGPVLVTRQGEMELVETARQQLRQEGGISLEDMRRELKL
jgi:hypothetical protein